MQWGFDALVIIKGMDRTDDIHSIQSINGKFHIIFKNSPRAYHYASNVQILLLLQRIDPDSVICKVRGHTAQKIEQILDFGPFYRIIYAGGINRSYRRHEVELAENCLHNEKIQALFRYFKETASAISLRTDQGSNLLEMQYNRVTAVDGSTVLSNYLDPSRPVAKRQDHAGLIFPFGINQSQKAAVENAFSSQVSIIQGPPGTGKTQTILNIIANAVWRGKTVAVVSNNNAATSNVSEKLHKQGLSFITAFLGSRSNKELFLDSQSRAYPDIGGWSIPPDYYRKLKCQVQQLSAELDTMLNSRNRIAAIEQELLALEPERSYFEQYYASKEKIHMVPSKFQKLSSDQLLALWLEYENLTGKPLNIFQKLRVLFRFGRAALAIFQYAPEKAIPFLQDLFYRAKLWELQEEKQTLERRLQAYHFQAKMDALQAISLVFFKASLAKRYQWRAPRKHFDMDSFRQKSQEFTAEYPVILSTTYSIKGTLSTDFIYDYLIVDEASQVDLATGVLAFSCAKNIIIVGDQKQLPNVITHQDVVKTDHIWQRYHFDEQYHFAAHSMLSSAAATWPNVPSVLLREHYRCHPKIAGFFNQKFYDGKLIIMTQDHGEKDVLTIHRTGPGNLAFKHWNQRQIDVIQQEILPRLYRDGYRDIGVIAPYCEQVGHIKKQLGGLCEIDTVHKFQGREKDAIILSTVDNIIGQFVDDPHMLNVAVSRAIRSLSVIISGNTKNDKTNYGDLVKYIRYNNGQLLDSKVFSIFDLLYSGYRRQRWAYLRKHKRISEFDSENLAYALIEKILQIPEFSKLGCVVHSSLSTLIRNGDLLTKEEKIYAFNPLTHLDFLLFNKMDKSPVLVIEVDGSSYHQPGSIQAHRDAMKNSVLNKHGIPILRLRTNESQEENRIISALRDALS